MKGYLDKRKDLRRKTRKTEWLQWLRGLTFSIVHWQSADHPPQKSRFKTIFNTLIFGQCCWRVLVKESFSRYCLGIGLAFWSQCLAFAWAKIGSKAMRVLLYSYMHWDERRHKQRNRSKCVPTRYNQGYIILGSFATEHHCGGHFHGRVAAMGKWEQRGYFLCKTPLDVLEVRDSKKVCCERNVGYLRKCVGKCTQKCNRCLYVTEWWWHHLI